MSRFNTIIPLCLLLAGCNLFNSDGNEEFEPIFKTEINGEPFDISGVDEPLKRFNAVVTTQGLYSYLGVFGDIYHQERFPYKQSLGFSLLWEDDKIEYPSRKDSVQINEFYDRTTGGAYYELDGDARISSFSSPTNDNGYITVEIEELDDGREVVFGSFEFTVVVDSRTDAFSQRVGQDTLYITNGEYRLLLDDRRDE